LNTIDYIDIKAKADPVEGGAMLARALMRGEKATLKQGYSIGNALIAVAERYNLTAIDVACIADQIAIPKPGIVDE